jgi:HD-GYP domain-containing protein (c-di-GMP phosphodiesterase class II)
VAEAKKKAKGRGAAERLQALQDISVGLIEAGASTHLLRDILEKSLNLLNCDAGSLYLKKDDAHLMFEVSVNRTLDFEFEKATIPITPHGLASYVFRSGETLKIDDVKVLTGREPFHFDPSFDLRTGYVTRSVLVQPLKSSKGEMLGVIQVINKKNEAGEAWPSSDAKKIAEMPVFIDEDARLLESFAAVASSSIENAQLYRSIEALFEGFVIASVEAIEKRDPTTRGHSDRVALLTVDLAQTVSLSNLTDLKDIKFSTVQIAEIRYAALLHDFGKIGVSESVLNKEEKLTSMQKLSVMSRFTEFKQSAEIKFLRELLSDLTREQRAPSALEIKRIEKRIREFGSKIDDCWHTLLELNKPTILNEDKSMALKNLEHIHCENCQGELKPLLQKDEISSLRILKGTLSDAERLEIESHVSLTYEFLRRIPWTKELSMIPELAFGHHEYLDGSGYPRKISGGNIPIQTRMMTICDIYDALVANDRPYKPALPLERALSILEMEARTGRLDTRFLKAFIEAKIWQNKEFLALKDPQSKNKKIKLA